MHAQGLVLDDLVDADVPPESWNHLMVRFVSAFLTPSAADALEGQELASFGDLWRAEVFGDPGRLPREVRDRIDALCGAVPDRSAAGMSDVAQVRALLERAERDGRNGSATRPGTPNRALRDQVLAAGMLALRTQGEVGVDVATLRRDGDLSPQSFHRMFGSREAFVRELRIHLEISRSANSIARFAGLVADSTGPSEMRQALERDGVFMQEEASRAAMWQRIETLDATRTDPELRSSLARVQRATRDLLIEQVCLAQSRGLMDPELPARSVARLLDGTVFWHVFYGLDARRPPRDAWIGMLRRIARLLSPDLRRADRATD
jgi:hypothetical protein